MKKIFEKTIKGILTNRDLMKNIFSGIGYFVLAVGILRVSVEFAKQVEWYIIIGIFLLFALLGTFAFFFWVLHVIRPIVQINWPEFGLPGIDSHAKPEMRWQMIKRFDFWVFLVLASLPTWVGWYLVSVILESE